MARKAAAIPQPVRMNWRRLSPSRLAFSSANSRIRRSTRFCRSLCAGGRYSPFDTIWVGIGVAVEAVSAPATRRCSRSLSQLPIVVLPVEVLKSADFIPAAVTRHLLGFFGQGLYLRRALFWPVADLRRIGKRWPVSVAKAAHSRRPPTRPSCPWWCGRPNPKSGPCQLLHPKGTHSDALADGCFVPQTLKSSEREFLVRFTPDRNRRSDILRLTAPGQQRTLSPG